jgi:hypothetical protein
MTRCGQKIGFVPLDIVTRSGPLGEGTNGQRVDELSLRALFYATPAVVTGLLDFPSLPPQLSRQSGFSSNKSKEPRRLQSHQDRRIDISFSQDPSKTPTHTIQYTVDYLITHRVGTDLNPMHYEIYAI